ncbi:obscurin-like isoform X2 [Palaemon carinicauda]|uniref:obscurin-like isoform X2 n=1 Tax=Palaemon carinicauda TaxID=392227 RepID=UPI0035B5F18A
MAAVAKTLLAFAVTSVFTYEFVSTYSPIFVGVKNLTVNEGETASFTCRGENLTKYRKIGWYRLHPKKLLSVGLTMKSDDPRLSVVHDDNMKWTLQITNVTRCDQGTYQCVVHFNKTSISQDAHLDVRGPRCERVNNFTAIFGGTASITCEEKNIPQDTEVEWLRLHKEKNDTKMSELRDQRISFSRSKGIWTLKITNVTKDDQGQYKCVFKTHPPVSQTGSLKLIGPIFVGEVKSLTVNEGETASFTCQVENLTKYRKIEWYRLDPRRILNPGSTMKFYDPRLSVVHDDNMKWTLQITNVTRDDQGRYQCTVNFSGTSISQVAHLYVRGPRYERVNNFTAIFGGTASITCEEKNIPQNTEVEWLRLHKEKNDTKMSELRDQRILFSRSKGIWTLKITNVTKDDQGQYKCVFKTHPPVSQTGSLKLIGPIFVGEVKSLTVNEGERASFTCQVENLTKYQKIEWYRLHPRRILNPGSTMKSDDPRLSVVHDDNMKWTLQITNVTRYDQGTYQCTVKFNGTSTSQVAHLDVRGPRCERVNNFTAIFGGTASITCEEKNIPQDTEVKWLRLHKEKTDTKMWELRDQRISFSRSKGIWTLKITNVTKDDQGQYKCVFRTQSPVSYVRMPENFQSINHSPVSQIVSLKLIGPIFVGEVKSLTVNEGERASFTCQVENLTKYQKIEWYRLHPKKLLSVGLTRKSDDPRLSVVHDDNMKWTLQITNVTRYDQGTYQCKVNFNGTSPSQVVHLYVRGPRYERVNTFTASFGGTASITCEEKNIPQHTEVKWLQLHKEKADTKMWELPDQRISFLGSKGIWTLKITNVTKDDQGQYKCVFKTHPPVSQTGSLKLIGPIFVGEVKSLTVNEGERASFTCQVENLSKYWKIGWYRLHPRKLLSIGLTRKSDDPRLSVVHDDNMKWTLQITNVTRYDQGRYQCTVYFNRTSISQVAHLYVRGPRYERVNTFTASFGGTASITCEEKNIPQHTEVKWLRLHKEKADTKMWELPDQRISFLGSKGIWTLKITNVTKDDQGQYKCVFKTHPPVSQTGSLKLIGPIFVGEVKSLTVNEGERASFTCQVENLSKYWKIVWNRLHPRKLLSIGLTRKSNDPRLSVVHDDNMKWTLKITNVTRYDQGRYQCVVNFNGTSISQVAHLYVRGRY